jgi:hypothetical protein
MSGWQKHWPAGVFSLLLLLGFTFGIFLGTEKSKNAPKATRSVAHNDKPKSKAPIGDSDASETPRVDPKQGPKAEPKKNDSTVSTQPKVEPKIEKTEPKMEPKMEPKTEPKTELKTEPKTEPKTPPKTEPKTEPKKVMEMVSFDQKIKPIFRAKCTVCHGDPTIKGKLDLRTLAAIKKGGDSGTGFDPGNLAGSLIWTRIEDKDMPMPPDGKEKLTPAEMKLIKDWILSGGK